MRRNPVWYLRHNLVRIVALAARLESSASSKLLTQPGSQLYHDLPMITKRLNAAAQEDREAAVALLRAGGIVAIPTETVYGLAADATNSKAVSAVYAAKQRPADHPLIVHIADAGLLPDWAVDIPAAANILAGAFWPGPLTMLLHRAPDVTPLVTGGLQTIGLRVPRQPILLELLHSSGLALAAPSANPYKQLSPTSAAQVLEKLDGRIDAVLDGGECDIGLESTIVDLTGEEIRVLRVGPITASQISAVLNRPVMTPDKHRVSVPGNIDQHYQPVTPLHVVSRDEMLARIKSADGSEAFVVLADFPIASIQNQSAVVIMPETKSAFARLLYKTLHELDHRNLRSIWFELPPQSEDWLDVNDRLRRASA